MDRLGFKTCIQCGAEKPAEEFYHSPRMADGRMGTCKPCHSERCKIRLKKLAKDPIWTEKFRLNARLRERNYRPLKMREIKARKLAEYAHRMGRLKPPEACEECGSAVRLDKHHPSYDAPLVVRWLCRSCHLRLHWQERKAS